MSKKTIIEEILESYIEKQTSENKKKAEELARSNDKFLSLASKLRFQIERLLKEAHLIDSFNEVHMQRLCNLGLPESDYDTKEYDKILTNAGNALVDVIREYNKGKNVERKQRID